MSLLYDVAMFLLPFSGLIPSFFILFKSYRKNRGEFSALERQKFKMLRRDIKTIKKSQPKSRYQSMKLLEDIFAYMPTRSWNFDGHTEFGKDQKEYHWSALALRKGKMMTVTIAWNTKYSFINYISTHVHDDKPSSYSEGNLPSDIDAKREKK